MTQRYIYGLASLSLESVNFMYFVFLLILCSYEVTLFSDLLGVHLAVKLLLNNRQFFKCEIYRALMTISWHLKGNIYNVFLFCYKVMVVPEDLFEFLLVYKNQLRPLLSKLGKFSRYLFTSSKQSQSNPDQRLDHSALSNALTRSFELAGVLKAGDKYSRVSPSRIRCAVVTELVGAGGENTAAIARDFMKHRESTSMKFYIQHWANREAMRISMKCYNTFCPPKVDMEKAVEHNEKV